MIAALIAACTTVAVLVGAMVWLVGVIRDDGRDRADALVLAAKRTGERDVERVEAEGKITRLADDVRRLTRRGDALEDYIRRDLERRLGGVDDGTDLLLAELSVVASGADLEITAVATGGDSRAGSVVPVGAAAADGTPGDDRDAALDDTVPGVVAP